MIDPKYDRTFRQLFGAPSNKLITKNFIQAVIKSDVKNLVSLRTFLNRDVSGEYQGVVDVLCESSDGEQYLVEIQRAYKRGFCQRLLFYGAKRFSGQVTEQLHNTVRKKMKKKSKEFDYSVLKKVIVIAIMNFPFDESPVSCHKIVNEKTLECRFDGLSFYTIDLTKFNLEVGELATPADAWCFFLKKIHVVNQETVNLLGEKHPDVQPAVEELRKFQMSPDEYKDYLVYRMNSDQADSWDDFLEDFGAEKERKCSIEIAKNMLAGGVSIEKICSYTGLKPEDFM